ncbi:EAL domain-containing protein [Marinobacter salinisoli]|uniref:EAL domain-containing protein n=1 Tax=Marinobacter salinisoli TaxID=2769486 RepID=A0ABX7MT51_9GAMM|nr:EAL domain-containing protein [Marinobacter salinisoli]QSP95488.1 EAL domain-containing protein [Marinobacter salinisoli]
MYLRACFLRAYRTARLFVFVTTLLSGAAFTLPASASVLASHLPADDGVSLAPHLVYQTDEQRNLSPEQVRDINWGWQSLSGEHLNLGFITDTVWIRFQLTNASATTQNLYLDIDYALLDEVELTLFSLETGRFVQTLKAGDQWAFEERPILFPNVVFPITLAPEQEYVVVMKIRSTSSMQVPISLWQRDALAAKKYGEALFFGGLIGMIAIMALYNLFLWISIRENAYLFYALCLIGYCFVEAILTGIGFSHVWPRSPEWNQISLVVSGGSALAALALFTHRFLKLQQRAPTLGRLFYVYGALCLLTVALAFVLPYQVAIHLTMAMLVLVPLSTYAASVYFWLHEGLKDARYFVTAFTLFTIFTLVLILAKVGALPRNWLTEYSIHFGAISVVALLSFALADRINREKTAREEAQKEAIAHLERYRVIHDESLEGRFRVDRVGRFVSANPALARIFGAENPDDLLRRGSNNLKLIPARRKKWEEGIELLTRHGKLHGFECEARRLSGELFWVSVYGRVVRDPDTKRPVFEGSLVDITDKKASEQQLNYLANHDPLTGLVNRLGFEKRLERAIESARIQGRNHALLMMDLDQFKIVNDTCGHGAGDQLLKQISALFQKYVRATDSLARLGGDEFALLLEKTPVENAATLAQRLRRDVGDYRFTWKGKVFSIGISIGVVTINEKTGTLAELVSLADTACYAAKDGGRNQVVVHDENRGDIAQRQTEMEQVTVIREAIRNNNLILFHQKVSPIRGNPQGDRYEVLVRMKREGRLVLPGAFLPAAERYNMIVELDQWVIQTYFKWLSEHPQHLQQLTQANINLSAQSVSCADLSPFIIDAFNRYGIPAHKICFEITESAAVASVKETQNLIERLRAIGCKFALDDFGSGFASYGHLKTLPVHCLKIDGCFIRGLATDKVDYEMVRAMTEVAHAMGLEVVAEYVENASIMARLTELNVDYAQGWHIHQPELLVATPIQGRREVWSQSFNDHKVLKPV